MNKEQEEVEQTEEEIREIKLEASVHMLYMCIEKLQEAFPFQTPNIAYIDSMATAIFNQAEVRSDIEDYVSLKIEHEND